MLLCQVLLELVAVQAPCQTLVAAALWSVANHSEESVAALAALDPQPLLQVSSLQSYGFIYPLFIQSMVYRMTRLMCSVLLDFCLVHSAYL
jgi:hypothetical protein